MGEVEESKERERVGGRGGRESIDVEGEGIEP